MKLYEIRVANLGIMRLRDTYYSTSQAKAMALFRKHKKWGATVDLYHCEVDTNLKADDWCALLESDAPGTACNMTPQDRITGRTLIATCAPDDEVIK